MSFQSFVTERLAAITALLNAINTNAKKIDELPSQNTLDPSSKIHVSRDGISESLEVQEIINSINNNSYNQLLSIGEITLVDNVITIPADARAQINQVNYNTVSITTIPIPYAAAGLTRTDILVFNTSSQIVRVPGTETAGIAVRPNIPIDTVLVTEINVTELAIGNPTPPVTVEALATKLDKDGYTGTAKTLDTRILDLELPDGVIDIGLIVQVGSSVTIAANEFSVRTNQIEVFNTAFTGTIASATDLYIRTDIYEIDTAGIIYIHQGVQDLEIAKKPDVTAGRYEIGSVNINGATVSPATTVPSGNTYVAKSEAIFTKLSGSGNKAQFTISNDSTNVRVISASSIGSVSIDKKYIYPGKDHYVKNETGTTLIIKHNSGTGNYKYNFPNATDLVIQNNEIVHFKFRFDTGNSGFLDYVGVASSGGSTGPVAIADVTGLTAELAAKALTTYVDSQDTAKLNEAKAYSDGLITQLINGAPSDANTLKELNDKILAVQAIIGGSTADGDSLVNTVAELLAVFATFPEGVDLVTLLAGKVNTSDVYNALDCIIAGKVADARQLKVLNDLITTLRADVNSNTTAIGLRELSSNKSQDIETDKASTTKFGSVKAFYDWCVGRFQPLLVSGTNIKTINGTSLLGSGNITTSAISAVRQISSATTLADSDNGLVIILTASCTVTIPNGLVANFECTLVTLAGATLTIAQGGSVTLLNNAGTTMAEKLSCTIKNTLTTNQYLTVGNL
jgi:hypothetical protein